MKNIIIFSLMLFSAYISAQEINWLTLADAEAAQKENPHKSYFIDFYTNWCGWCKKMDQSTFKEAEVVKHINENYIPVKFNAESKEDVTFKGKVYKYVKASNGRGVNSFAYFSLMGKLSYPSYAVINGEGETEKLLLGFMPKDKLIEGLNAKQ